MSMKLIIYFAKWFSIFEIKPFFKDNRFFVVLPILWLWQHYQSIFQFVSSFSFVTVQFIFWDENLNFHILPIKTINMKKSYLLASMGENWSKETNPVIIKLVGWEDWRSISYLLFHDLLKYLFLFIIISSKILE